MMCEYSCPAGPGALGSGPVGTGAGVPNAPGTKPAGEATGGAIVEGLCRDQTYAAKSGNINEANYTCSSGLECVGYEYNVTMGKCEANAGLGAPCRNDTYVEK